MIDSIVVGADEAGRGLIIGPMVISACAINNEIAGLFQKSGIKDSKDYSSLNKIRNHAIFIKKHALAWSERILTADVLNNFNKNQMSMDEAEAYAFFRVIEDISKKVKNIKEYQVDNFQAVNKLKELLVENPLTKEITLIVKPRAEKEFISVSAGSILARTKALEELEKIKTKYGDFGSGSTSDKKTINWLKNYYIQKKSWPENIVRTYWKTINKIEREIK